MATMITTLSELAVSDLRNELVVFIDEAGADLMTTPVDMLRQYGDLRLTGRLRDTELFWDAAHTERVEPAWLFDIEEEFYFFT